jgi:WD repeat-containing protein 19
MQASSPTVVFWHREWRETKELDMGGYKDLTFLRWSPSGQHIAIGTAKGTMLICETNTKKIKEAALRHKRRIICGDWNIHQALAFASEDKCVFICNADGETIDQVKVKCRPLSCSFGGTDAAPGSVVSLNMEGKTILLYSLVEKDALELAFQKRYGTIVRFEWFGECIIAGFSSGTIVVISTRLEEVGREQYCGKFHDDELRDIAHCPATNLVASCSDRCVKIIDMLTWKEVKSFVGSGDDQFEKLSWTDSGKFLSVSSKNGCLLTFLAKDDRREKPGASGTHSAVAVATQPMSVAGLVACLALVLAMFVTCAANYFGVSAVEFLTAAFIDSAMF